MKKLNSIIFLFLVTIFSLTKSFAQVIVEKPEIFQKNILTDSISKLYAVEYNSPDSNEVTITKIYPSGHIYSKWYYTSLRDSIITNYEIWYENGKDKRKFTLNSDIDQKSLKKNLTQDKKYNYFYHINKYYNGELKTYWENGQIKRHDVFIDGKKKTGITWDQNGKSVEYYYYIVEPQFPGGEFELRKYIFNSIKYPELAIEYKIRGCVWVSFDIEKDGSLSNIKIAKSVAKILDDEAIRVIKSMPNWDPGKEDGENFKCFYMMPINFQME